MRKKWVEKCLFSVIGVIFLLGTMPLTTHAQLPMRMNYQGYLTDSGGTPVNGTVSMTFSLYSSSSGGGALWWETHSVPVTDGVYSVILGNSTPLDPADFTNPLIEHLYLGVQVGTDSEMTPRQEISSVAFAINADKLDGQDASAFLTTETDPTVPASLKNGISWAEVSGRPTGLDDGDDVGITTETDPTVPATLKDGISWTEVSNRPAGLDDGDDTGITSETDPQVGNINPTCIPVWDGSQLVNSSIYTMVVSGESRLGVCNYNPQHTLHVSGDFRAEGAGYFAGDILAEGTGYFDGSGDEAVLYLGDSNNFIKAIYGYGLKIGTFGAEDAISIKTISGNVGIGTVNPSYGKLHVYTDEANNAIYGLAAGAGSGLYVVSTNTGNGSHGAVAITHSNNSGHAGIRAVNNGTGPGILAEAGSGGYAAKFKGDVAVMSRTTDELLVEIGEGLDYAEGFDVTGKAAIRPGAVLVIDPNNPGRLTLSSAPYDTKVAGIVAGANSLGSGVRLGAGQFDHNVALAGRVYCNVDAMEDEVRPGDLLTTSSTPGYAMKADDYSRAQGAILGKAMQGLAKGETNQILVLVTLQ